MPGSHPPAELHFPFEDAPPSGIVTKIMDGLFWARIPLPYRLDHVNVYFLEDGDRWCIVDTGINTPEAIAAWETLFNGPFAGAAISRVIVTHHHPDHIGLAGWICRRFGAELLTSQTSYMTSKVISLAPHEMGLRGHFEFYVRHGMSEENAGIVAIQGNEYLERVSQLPPTFLRLLHADRLKIGKREFRVMSGDGHAAEQIMLYCPDDNIFFSADQVMERITPNVSVYAAEPNGDPLGHFLRTLRRLRQNITSDPLVLPGHRRPFKGLEQRCLETEMHHEERCQMIRDVCKSTPSTVAELVPVLFRRALDPHQMSFAFTETLAHVNYLVRRNELAPHVEGDRIRFSLT